MPVFEQLRGAGLAALRYEPQGHPNFQDRLTLGRNGRVLFERYGWGEAAGLVFRVWGKAGAGARLAWELPPKNGPHPEQRQLPLQLTAVEDGLLQFDEKRVWWQPAKQLKRWPQGRLGFWGMLFARK